MIETMLLAILIGAGLVVFSIFTSLIAFRFGAPLLLIFLGIGLAAGVDGIGGIDFENVEAAYFIGSIALAVILFDSGLGTRLTTFRLVAGPAIVLATLGVLLTAALLAVPAHYLLGFDWLEALLLGALVGSTDAAAVFFLLRVGGIRIRERVRATLEIESASNDPMAIFLTVTLVSLIAAGEIGPQHATSAFLEAFVLQMGLGLLAGLAGGWLVVQTVNRVTLETGLYPIVVIGLALCLFSVTSMLGGSGFLAVFVAGLIAGNLRMRGGLLLRRFQEGLTWLAQITMFLVLGLLATPSEFPAIVWQAVALALALTFFARPLAVWLCLLPFGFRRDESSFIAWVGLRGAVSILLAILPIVGGLENGQLFFNTAFIIVLTSLLIQGWTIRPMARWLGLIVPPRIGPLEKVELELPGAARHELVVYRISANSPVARGERIPRWARPSLIVRDGRSMRIHEAGRLGAGDYVYIFVPPNFIGLLDRLFASPAEIGDSDSDYFGAFTLDPERPIGDVARSYGFAVDEEAAGLTVADYLRKRLGGAIGRGDRLPLPPVELIVREVDEEHRVLAVGLGLEPGGDAAERIPFFQSYHEIAAALRRLASHRRAGKKGAAPPDPPLSP